MLCDIILDICYQRSGTKQFAWDICGGEIVENLMVKNNGIVRFPVSDENGEIGYGGGLFTINTIQEEFYDIQHHT